LRAITPNELRYCHNHQKDHPYAKTCRMSLTLPYHKGKMFYRLALRPLTGLSQGATPTYVLTG